MRSRLALAALLLAAAAAPCSAQTAGPDRGAKSESEGHAAVGEPLEAGANSFTEAQVTERFDRMGFGTVRDLRKDASGSWHGTATHAGKEVRIGMDYKGNVAAQ